MTLTLELKLFKRLLHDRKGDAKLQGFRVTDPLDFQIPERLDEPVAELTRAGVGPHLGHAEAQGDLPVQPLDNEKSVKFELFRYCPAQRGFPMRASDSSVGGNVDRVAKVQVGNRALIAAQGRLKP